MIEVRHAIFSGALMHTALAESPMRAQKALSTVVYYATIAIEYSACHAHDAVYTKERQLYARDITSWQDHPKVP